MRDTTGYGAYAECGQGRSRTDGPERSEFFSGCIWRRTILGANGIVFYVVAAAQDISTDEQLIVNDILVPFDRDTTLTVTSPIFMEGQEKVKARRPPTVGQHTDKVLCVAGDAQSIKDFGKTALSPRHFGSPFSTNSYF